MQLSRIDPAEIDLRPQTPADAEAVAAIVREHIGEALPPPLRDGPLLDVQLRGREAGLAAGYANLSRRVAVVGDEVAGLMLVDRGVDALHVVEIAVAGDWRRRGIASALLAIIVAEARSAGLSTTASIFPGNAASLALFEAAGFALEHRPGEAQVRARSG